MMNLDLNYLKDLELPKKIVKPFGVFEMPGLVLKLYSLKMTEDQINASEIRDLKGLLKSAVIYKKIDDSPGMGLGIFSKDNNLNLIKWERSGNSIRIKNQNYWVNCNNPQLNLIKLDDPLIGGLDF